VTRTHPLPGLYLHIPFCSRICPYCDFAVVAGGAARRRGFVDALLAEIALWAGVEAPWSTAAFDTVYLGGGTPSALAPEQLEQLLAAVRANLPIASEARLFLEANPEDVTAESLRAWRELGFATLSLGVQSFEAAELAFLGRGHTPGQARTSVLAAREAGFATVSLDLIFGLPEQTPASWRRNLRAAAEVAPDHVSCYQLTLHEGTPFGRDLARGRLAEMPEPAQADLFALTHDLLEEAGYAAYEVSNFARAPEHRSRHNRKYWDHTPYLGLGPSAHSFDGRRRWWNERRLGAYQERVAAGERPIAGSEDLTAGDLALETVMLGLRITDGIDLERFRERFGRDLLASNTGWVERSVAAGLLETEGGRLKPTRAGLAVAEALVRGFELEEPLPQRPPSPAPVGDGGEGGQGVRGSTAASRSPRRS
jgi:putative oxygen-independent coproporphyrinogen III oxidase